MCTVIYDLAWTCHCACLEEIDSKAVATEDAMLCSHSITVAVLDAAFCNVIFKDIVSFDTYLLGRVLLRLCREDLLLLLSLVFVLNLAR